VYVEEMQRKWSANTIALTRRKILMLWWELDAYPVFIIQKL
jgi:hypothetical protein